MRFFRKRDKNTSEKPKPYHIFKKPIPKTPNTNGLVKASNKENALKSIKNSNDSKKFGLGQHVLAKELDPSVTFNNTQSSHTENVKQRPRIPNSKKENSFVNNSLNYVHNKSQNTSPNFISSTKKYGQESSLTSSLSSDDDSIRIYSQNVKSKSKDKRLENAPHQLTSSLHKYSPKLQMNSAVTSSSNSSLSSSNPIVSTKNTSEMYQNFRPPPNPWQTNSSPQPKIHRNVIGVSSSSISSSSWSSSLSVNRYSSLKYPKNSFTKPQSVEKAKLIFNDGPHKNLLHQTKQPQKISSKKSSSSSFMSSSESIEKIKRKLSETMVTKKPISSSIMKHYTLKTSEAKSSSQQESPLNQTSESSSFSSDTSVNLIKNYQPSRKKEITQKISTFKSSSSSISFSSTFSSSQTFTQNYNEKDVKKQPIMVPNVSLKKKASLISSVGLKFMSDSNREDIMVSSLPKNNENTIRKTIIVKKTEWIPKKQHISDEIMSNTKRLGHFLYDTSSDTSHFEAKSVTLPKTISESGKQNNFKSSVPDLKTIRQPIERTNNIEQRQLTPEKENFIKNYTYQSSVDSLEYSSISSISDFSNDLADKKIFGKEKQVEKKTKGISTSKKRLKGSFKNISNMKDKKNVVNTSTDIQFLQTVVESMMRETLEKYEKRKINDDLKKDLSHILQNQLEYFEKRSQETQTQNINTLIKRTRKELQNFVKDHMLLCNEKQKLCFSEQNGTHPSHEEMMIMEKALKRFHEDQQQIMHDFFHKKSMIWEAQLEHLKNTLLERNNTLKAEVANSMRDCMMSLTQDPKETHAKPHSERFHEKNKYDDKQLNLLYESFIEELRNSKKESDQLYQSTVLKLTKLLDRKNIKLGKYKKILEHLLDVNQIVRKRVDRMELNKRNLVQKLKESYIDQERFTLALKQCVPLDTTVQMAAQGLLKGQALQKIAHIATQMYRQTLLFVLMKLRINSYLQKPYILYQKPIHKTLTVLNTKLLTHPTSNLQNVLNFSWLPMCSVLLEKQAGFVLAWVNYLSNSILVKHQIWVFSRLRYLLKLHHAKVAQRVCMEHFAYYLKNFVSFVVFRNKHHVFISLTKILSVSLDPHVPPYYTRAYTLKYDEKDYFKWLPKTDALNQGKWIQTTPQLPHQYVVAEKLSSKKIPKLLSYKPFVYDIPLELPKTIPLLYNAHNRTMSSKSQFVETLIEGMTQARIKHFHDLTQMKKKCF